MPEYYDPKVKPVQARPFTFQELLVIPSMYKESYEKSMKEYNDYADKAALIRSMAGESPTAQKAFAEYDNGVKGLSEAMLSGRWNPQMAAEAQNLREMYRNKIIPIGTAINNYQEDLKRFDALNKDGKAFGNTATLENYIQDPNYRGRFYSGSALQQEAMTAGALAANGITPQQLAEYYSNPSAPQFKGINDVVNRILAENGYNSLDDDAKKQMRGYVMNGLGMGLQASANKTYDEALKYQRDLNKIAYSHSFSNNNGGGGGSRGSGRKGAPTAVLDKDGKLLYYKNSKNEMTDEKGNVIADDTGNPIKIGGKKGNNGDDRPHSWTHKDRLVAPFMNWSNKEQRDYINFMLGNQLNGNNFDKIVPTEVVPRWNLSKAVWEVILSKLGGKVYKATKTSFNFNKKAGWSFNYSGSNIHDLDDDEKSEKNIQLRVNPFLPNALMITVGNKDYYINPVDLGLNQSIFNNYTQATKDHLRHIYSSPEKQLIHVNYGYNDYNFDAAETAMEQQIGSLGLEFGITKTNSDKAVNELYNGNNGDAINDLIDLLKETTPYYEYGSDDLTE